MSENRIIYDMANAEYHDHPAISSSAIREALRSPAHYHAAYVERSVPRTESPSMKLGTAVHTLVLEPEKWESEYVIVPTIDRRTKAGKEAWAAFMEEAGDRVLMTEEEAAHAKAVAQSVLNHSAARELVEGIFERPVAEASVFWRDEETGLELKCRPDALDINDGVIVDLKTTRDASPSGFPKSVANFGYHTQAAWYQRGVEAALGISCRHVIVSVETTAPYAVGVYELDEDALYVGAELARLGLERIASGLHSGEWPAYGDEVQQITLPGWAKKEVAR